MITESARIDPKEVLERNRELYLYSVNRLNVERDRFFRSDEKATKLATVFTFITGGVTYFGNWVLQNDCPPKSLFGWSLFVFSGIALVVSFTGWYLAVRATIMRKMAELPLDDEVVKFFQSSPLPLIYQHWANVNAQIVATNMKITDRKHADILASVRALRVMVFLLVFLTFLYALRRLTNV